MADTFAREVRSRLMSRVRVRDTAPEIALRRALWRHGARGWRVSVRALRGRPDVVFARARVAIFVDGSFWHGHPRKFRFGRSGAFWDRKIGSNIERDRRIRAHLRREGWSVLRVWDVDALKNPDLAAQRVMRKVSARDSGLTPPRQSL